MASMRKSVKLLAAAGFLLVAALVLVLSLADGAAGRLAAIALGLATLACAGLALSGRMVVERQRRMFAGEPDLYLEHNAPRGEAAVAARRVGAPGPPRRVLARSLFGHRLLVGETVQVRSLEAIRATLDDKGCLAGMPFMDEMAAFCGKTAIVYRVIDKVYDYARSRDMRRLDDCVLLAGLRCDGSQHGGCQAECYLMWKVQWLEPASTDAASAAPPTHAAPATRLLPSNHCQYTELTKASRSARPLSWHGTLGPWAAGNVTTRAFLTLAATRAFNRFQAMRGGVSYPTKATSDGAAAPVAESVQAGDWVRIRLPREIARTLDKKSRNRGLSCDSDMLKFCGQRFRVRARVQQIVDINTHTMIQMKTPCIILDDVHYTGEFQVFGEQHEYLYWREAWLQAEAPGARSP